MFAVVDIAGQQFKVSEKIQYYVPKLNEDDYFWLPINFESESQACSLVFNFGSPEADFLPQPPDEQGEVDCFLKKDASLCEGSDNLLNQSIAKTF